MGAFDFEGIVRGFSAGGNKVEGALALLNTLWEAGKAVVDVVKASTTEQEEQALAKLDAEIQRVGPLATGLGAIVKAQQEAALQALKDKFGSTQP